MGQDDGGMGCVGDGGLTAVARHAALRYSMRMARYGGGIGRAAAIDPMAGMATALGDHADGTTPAGRRKPDRAATMDRALINNALRA